MSDKELIEKLGGVKAISDALGYNYTTVHNWLTRGISRDAKIAHPKIFLVKNIEDIKHISYYIADSEEESQLQPELEEA
ncbi:hypothetical protein [Psychrobacter pygoscelis]|uniref:hypothetical protein n=1 Tax=Psychrobacter pygoscelis TaxID=2488563 RepID=UPI001038C98E|nr:hypothetical protein [Psychrobacter pygoscelis]